MVGLSRSLDKMEELAEKLSEEKGVLHPIQCDLGDLEGVIEIFQKILEDFGPISILINNAAVLIPSNITGRQCIVVVYTKKINANHPLDGNLEDWRIMFDVNVTAPLLLTKETIKSMEVFGVDGHIININSTAGHTIPNFASFGIYCATKHSITAITAITRQELIDRDSKIKISVSPMQINKDQ